MKPLQDWLFFLAGASLLLSGCGQTDAGDAPLSEDSAAAVLSPGTSLVVGNPENRPADPYLVTSPTGRVYLSWTEDRKEGKGRDGFVGEVTDGGQTLTDTRQMNQAAIASHGGENLAKIAVGPGDTVFALWTTYSDVPRATTLKVAHAAPGQPFSPEQTLNDDDREISRANFTALAGSPDGRMVAAWLDGRNDLDAKEVFMSVVKEGESSFGANYQISDWACPCCRPDIDFLNGGKTVVVAKRQFATPSGYIEPDNIRNHVLIRSEDGGKTFGEPVTISDDGWVTYGCPHAGISITADGHDGIHAAWWTGGRLPEEAGIYYSYSEDGGRSFRPRERIADAPEDTILHTQITVAEDDTVYTAWEGVVENGSRIFLAHREGEGMWSQARQVSGDEWNASFPMLTSGGENLHLAWTERKGESSRVRLQTIRLEEE